MSNSRRFIFLIHGVGNPKPGSVRNDFLRKAGIRGVAEADVVELNWNALIPRGLEGQRVNHDWLVDIARSIQSAASIGFGLDRRLHITDRTAKYQDTLATLLRIVASCAPLLLIWGLLCLMYSTIQTDADTPWVDYRFIPASYKKWWSGTLFLVYPLSIGKWPSVWQAAYTAWAASVVALILLIAALGLFDSTKSSFLTSVRRAILLAIAPIIYAIGLPFVLRITTTIGVLCYLAASTFIGVPVYTEEIVSASTVRLTARVSLSQYVSLDQAQFVFLTALSVLAVAIIVLLIASPMLKVLADIFRYLGNTTYKEEIQSGLRDKIGESLDAAPGSRVILAGHSLGSVIALNALRARDTILTDIRDLELVTGGSPLLRMFHRFFPRHYLRPSAECDRLRNVYQGLRWTNVFRPLDYVGACLSRKHESIWNIRVPQRLRFHIGYWSDKHVISAVVKAVNEPRGVEETAPSLLAEPIADKNLGSFEALHPHWQPIFLIGLALVTALNFAVTEPLVRHELLDGQREELLRHGDTVPGRLYRVEREVWEEDPEFGGYIDRVHEFWVHFSDERGVQVAARLNDRFHDVDQMETDLDKLDEASPSHPESIRAVGKAIQVTYFVGNTSRAHAPKYYRESLFSWWRIVGAIVQLALGAIFAALIPIPIFHILLGSHGTENR